ncbi:hypothetical protein KO497_03255 [Pacificibacter marinus]|nr:hypothetical protein [Pacificibacter marinus]
MWVLVSLQRNNRPWQGRSEPVAPALKPAHDRPFYLCASNTRVSEHTNARNCSAYLEIGH